MSEEEKAIKFLQFCAENFEINERIEKTDNPFLFAKAIIENQQKEIERLNRIIKSFEEGEMIPGKETEEWIRK